MYDMPYLGFSEHIIIAVTVTKKDTSTIGKDSYFCYKFIPKLNDS